MTGRNQMDWSNAEDVRAYHRAWNAAHRPPAGNRRTTLVPLTDWIERKLAPPNARGCRIWTGKTDANGYGLTWEKGRLVRVHRAVWQAAHGATDLFICHRCDVPACAELTHLFAGTHADNMRDMTAKGRSKRGATNPNAKLKLSEVKHVRDLYATGDYTLRELARIFGISKSMVDYIVRQVNWRDWT